MRFLRNLLVTIVVLLVLLGVGVVATDGMLRDEVERRAAAQIQKPAGFAQKPTVTVEGFPLAYFVLIQEIPAVRVQGDSLTAQVGSNTTVRLSAVDVTLHQVRVQPRTVESDQVSGTAAVSYADLGAGLGLTASPAAAGLVTFTSEATVLGHKIPIHVTGRLAVDQAAQTVAMVDSVIDVGGVSVPSQVSKQVVAAMLKPVHLPLPYGLKLTDIDAGADGVTLHVSGANVSIPHSR